MHTESIETYLRFVKSTPVFSFYPDILSRVTGCVLGKLRNSNGISTTASGNSKSSMNHVTYSFSKEGNFNFLVCRALWNIKIPKIVSKMLGVSKMKITKWKNERSFHKFPYLFYRKFDMEFHKSYYSSPFSIDPRTYRLTFLTLIHITTMILRMTNIFC